MAGWNPLAMALHNHRDHHKCKFLVNLISLNVWMYLNNWVSMSSVFVCLVIKVAWLLFCSFYFHWLTLLFVLMFSCLSFIFKWSPKLMWSNKKSLLILIRWRVTLLFRVDAINKLLSFSILWKTLFLCSSLDYFVSLDSMYILDECNNYSNIFSFFQLYYIVMFYLIIFFY